MSYKIVAFTLLAALLSGCSNASSTPTLPAGPLPFASLAVPNVVGAPPPPVNGSPIQHVIVVVQENRSFDNMFNGFPGADSVSRGRDHNGKVVPLVAQGLEWPFDPSHTHQNLVKEYNGGAMNGFDRDPCDFNPLNSGGGGKCTGFFSAPPNFAYSFVPQSEVQFLWILAGEYPGIGYGLADRMFSSRQVPSFPGHQYLIAGQSKAANNPFGPKEGALVGLWGCDAPKKARVMQFGAAYSDPLTGGYPCYDYQTLADLMDAKGVSWKYYTGAIGTGDGTLNGYDAILHIRNSRDWTKNIVTPMTDIFNDLESGKLPQVSFVTPPGPASDHAGFMTGGGPAWVLSIYAFLTQNPKLYANTAILVTWDDSGGWYDHVAPPSDAFGPLGFRVPLMIMAPYARQRVSHKTHSFGSILHYIEKNWRLGTLGQQDASSDDLGDMFDYKQKPIPPIVNFGHFSRSAFVHKYSPEYWRALARDPRPVDTDQ